MSFPDTREDHPSIKHQPSKGRGSLLRVLGVGFGLAVTIGGTIGMGILRTPGEVASQLPTPTLFIGVWILGGVYALLGVISVAELGTMIPRSGGWYVFIHRAMGNYPGFVVGWSDWLSTCGTLGVIAIVVGEYIAVLIPGFAGRDKQVAIAVVLLFAALQWRGIRWGSLTQNLTSLLKTIVFAAIAIAAFTIAGKSDTVASPAPHGLAFFTALIVALQGVLYTYDGWYGVIYFGEEVRNPKRDVIGSMFGGVLLVIAIYLVVNIAYIHVLPMSQLAHEDLPAGAVARVIFGAYGDKAIRILAILSLLSTVNAYTLTAPRILYAMSCDELFHRQASRVNSGGTPTITLLISVLAAVLFIVSAKFTAILAALAFFFVANYSMAYISVIVLRRREPDLPRPYRVWGYPWTTLLVLLGSIAFLVGAILSDKKNSLVALAILAASVPIYLISKLFSPSRNG